MIEFVTSTGEKGTLDGTIFTCPGFDGVLNSLVPLVNPTYGPSREVALFLAVQEQYPFIEMVTPVSVPDDSDDDSLPKVY